MNESPSSLGEPGWMWNATDLVPHTSVLRGAGLEKDADAEAVCRNLYYARQVGRGIGLIWYGARSLGERNWWGGYAASNYPSRDMQKINCFL